MMSRVETFPDFRMVMRLAAAVYTHDIRLRRIPVPHIGNIRM